MPDLEGGTSIILIPRETFRLPGTQISLPLFEVDEATASDLRPEGWSGLKNGGVLKRRCITYLVLLGA